MSSSRLAALSSERMPSELERTDAMGCLLASRLEVPAGRYLPAAAFDQLAHLVRIERVAQPVDRFYQLPGFDLVLVLAREAARRAQHVLAAQLGRRRAAGQRLGVRRVAAQQPRGVRPAHELLALGELAERRRDGRAAGADELAEDPVRER